MIEIKTLAWNMDHASRPGEQRNANLYSRVFVDGVEIPGVMRARVLASPDDFAHVMLRLMGDIRVESLDEEQWKALGPSV